MWTRRQLGLMSGGLLLPKSLLARRAAPARGMGSSSIRRGSASSRRFVFVFNDGGWDTSHVFSPMWDVGGAYMDPAAELGHAHGIDFVDHPDRPQVRSFFETWGDRVCVLNGMEVRSVTHERSRRIVLTGGGSLNDDWASLLASHGSPDLLMPHVILDGPAFTDRATAAVVRVGDDDQLPSLLSGEAVLRSDLGVSPLDYRAAALADRFVADRAAAGTTDFSAAYAQALDRIDGLKDHPDLDLSVTDAGCERDITADCALAFDLFSRDLSRCAMLRSQGWCSEGWDTHQGLHLQSRNFDDLFGYLDGALFDLSTRTGPTGTPLADDVVFVVFSEMGRDPQLNSWGGRDHWTFTSVMLIGAGIQGGQVLGGHDAYGRGRPMDLQTGAATDSGAAVIPEHLGATLLKLGDVDPAEYVGDIPAIEAALL